MYTEFALLFLVGKENDRHEIILELEIRIGIRNIYLMFLY